MADYWESDRSGWFTGGQEDGSQNQQQQSGYYYGQTQAAPSPADYPSYGMPDPGAQQYGGGVFYPDMNAGVGRSPENVDFEDEPPLLEELGINFDHIRQKTMAVLNPIQKADPGVIADQDLAGPLVFCLLFGGALLLHGKMTFGYIYGIGVLGCIGMYCLLNLMAPSGISLTCTVSVLGYCLLPMALLSFLAVLASFKGIVGLIVSIMAVVWCSYSAAKLFVTALSMDHQQLLVAYPCCLVYAVFALLAIF